MTVTFDRPVIIIDTPTPASPSPTPLDGAATGVKAQVNGDVTPVDPTSDPDAGCPDGVPWCLGDRDWHDLEDGDSNHDSPFVIVPTDAACTRHDEEPGTAHEVWLAIEREDVAGEAGTPRLWLSAGPTGHVCAEDAHLSLDRAEQLANEILRLVAASRDAKRAKDIRPGDVLVIDGVGQVATVVLLDSECCPNRETGVHECDGSVSIETEVSGEGNWAATYDMDELVQVRAEVTR